MINPSETDLTKQPQFVDQSGNIPSPSDKILLNNAICKGLAIYPDLAFTKRICDKGEVTQQCMYHFQESNYFSVARILFFPTEPPVFTYEFQMLFTSISSGTVQTLNELFGVCSTISRSSQNKFCPGLDEKCYFDQYYAVIRYHIKGVRLWGKPFSRIDSESCLMWHKLTKNACTEEKKMFAALCKQCKRLQNDL